jgi:hypothetical protein
MILYNYEEIVESLLCKFNHLILYSIKLLSENILMNYLNVLIKFNNILQIINQLNFTINSV